MSLHAIIVRTCRWNLAALAVGVAACLMQGAPARAQSVWDGGGADDFWLTPVNWAGDVAPAAGAALQFAGTTRLTPNNNFTADTSFAGITYNAGAGGFTLSGNGITLTGALTNSSSNLQTVNVPIKLSANLAFTGGAAGFNLPNSLTNTATVSGTQEVTLSGTNGKISGVLSSGGALATGAGLRLNVNSPNNSDTWSLLGSNTSNFTGQLFVTQGVMNYGSATDAPNMTIVRPSGGTIGEFFTVGAGGINTSGTFNMAGGSLTLNDGQNNSGTTSVRLALANTAAATGNSGSATWNQTGGTITMIGFNLGTTPGVFGANQTGTTTAFNISGGLFDSGSSAFNIAVRGVGSLNVSGTGLVRNTGLGNNASSATLGITINDDRQPANALASVGTLNLDGGTLETSAIRMTADRGGQIVSSVLNFNGGTLRALATNPNYLILCNDGSTTDIATVNVRAGGARIDSNGFDIGSTMPLLHEAALGATADGGLTKSGAGTLTLNVDNTYTGPTTINAGTLQVGSGGATGSISTSGGVSGASGATLSINSTSNQTLGPVTGGLSLAKSGTGNLAIGVSNYTGATALNAGTMSIATGSSIGAITVAGGTLAPGSGGIGTITTTNLSATSGGLLMELSGANSDVINVTSAASLAGSSLTMGLLAPPTQSNYTLVTAGTLTGLPTLTNPTIGRTSFVLSQVGSSVRVTVTGAPASLRWDNSAPATGDGATWDTQVNQNWRKGTTPDQFFEADTVTFNDQNNGHYNVNVNGTVNPFAITVDNSAGDYVFSGGAIGGAGTLTKSGGRALTLSGANSYTGGTLLNAGTLNINNAGTATGGAIGTGRLTINGGVIDNTSGGDIVLATNNPQTWAASFSFAGTGNLSLGTGNVTLNAANPTVTVGGNTLTIGGAIANGTGNSFTKAGAGTLTLGGLSTFTGGLNIDGGAVRVTGATAGGAGAATVNTGGTLVLAGALSFTTPITLNGGTLGSSGGPANISTSGLTAATGTTSTIVAADPQGTPTQTNSEMILTGVLHGSGEIVTQAGNNNLAPDSGPGFRLRGTGASDFTGTLTFSNANGFGTKGELQTTVAGPFSPAGTGKLKIAAGTYDTTLNGTYTEFNLRNNGSANTTFGNDVIITGTGLADMNLLGTAPAAGSTLTTTMGNLSIGAGQILGVNKTSHTLSFPTVTLSGSATFAPATPAFGAVGPANLVLGNIGESTAGSGVTMDGGNTATAGFGILFLNGNNTFTGGLTINNGTVQIGNAGALNATAPNRVIFAPNAGTGITATGAAQVATLRLAGTSVTAGGLSSDPASPGAAAVENASATAATLTVNNAIDNTFAGVLRNGTGTGPLALTKGGTGKLTLSGANSYTGPTTVTAGTLRIGDPATQTGALASTAISVSGATLQLGVNSGPTTGLAAGTNITLGSGSTSGTFDLAGFSTSISSVATSGTGTANRVGNSGNSPATLVVNSLSPTTFSGVIQDALPGGSSTTALTLAGGSFTLGGANTYTGGTIINGGTLTVTGSLAATGMVAVNSSGTFAATGGVGSVATQAGSVLRAGVSPTDGITNTISMNGLLIGGGDLQFELISSGNNDKFTVTGPATFSGASTITPTASATANGTYTLITASGGVAGTPPTVPTGARQTFALHFADATSGPNAVTLTVTGSPKTLTWTGAASAVWTSGAAGPLNWSDDGGTTTNERFFNLDSVLFGNGGANHSITLNSSVSPGAVIVNNDASNPYSISGTGEITGAASITKSGVGTLTLATNNTYSGATTINAGTLQVGNGGTTGSLGSAAVVNNSILAFNRSNALTVNNNIGGTGSVQQNGSGTVTLAGTNSYGGGTLLNSGTIQVAADEKLGSASGALTFNGGTLNTTTSFTTARGMTMNAGGGTLAADDTTTLTQTAAISGAGPLRKSGLGTLLLAGSNTFTGGLVINDGTVQIGSAGALNATTPDAVSFGPAAPTTARLQLNGNNLTISGLSTDVSPGTPIVENGTSTAVTLTVNSTANTTFGGTIQNGGSALALTKTGIGKLTLSGTNSYTGVTTIDGGGTIEAGPATAFAGLSGQVHFLNGTFHVTGAPGDVVLSAGTSNKYTTSGTGGSTGTFDIDAGVTLQVGNPGTTAALQTAGAGTAGANFTKTGPGTLRIMSQNNQLDVALILQQGTIDAQHFRGLGGIDAAANFVDFRSNDSKLVLDNDGGQSQSGVSPGLSGSDFLSGLRAGTAGSTMNIEVNRLTPGDGITHGIGALQSAGDFTMHVAPGANMVSGTAGLYVYPSVSAGGTAGSTGVAAAVLSGNATFEVVNGAGASTVMTINGGITTNPANSAFGVTKTGSGTLLLSSNPNGANGVANLASAFTGPTRVNQGTLQLAASNLIPGASPIVLGGGKLDVGAMNQSFSTLTMAAPSGLDLGNNAAVVTFANSSALTWTAGGTFSILNWTGTPGVGGGTDQVIFGTSSAGLTSNQLSLVHFQGFNGATIKSNGEVVPTSASTRLLGDFDLNGHVNAADIGAALTAVRDLNSYRTTNVITFDDVLNVGDLDGSGNVTNADLQGLIEYLKSGHGSAAPVPEPATAILAAIGAMGLTLVFRRRRC